MNGRDRSGLAGLRRYLRMAWPVIAVALALRLLLAVTVPVSLVHDHVAYHGYAMRLLDTGELTTPDGRPTAYRPIGYPGFVAAVYAVAGPSPRAVRLAQALLSAAFLLPMGWAAFRLHSLSASRLLLWIGALYPSEALGVLGMMSEPLFLALLGGVIAALLPWLRGEQSALAARAFWLRLVIAGLLGGMLGLVKAYGLAFAPLLLGAAALRRSFWRGRTLAGAAAAVALSLLVVSPWLLRNERVVGAPVISTNGGATLWVGNHPGATGGYRWQEPPVPLPRGELARDRALRYETLRALRQDPLAALRRVPVKWAYLVRSESGHLAALAMLGDESVGYRAALGRVHPVALYGVWFAHVIVFGLAWWGWCFGPRGRWRIWTAALVAFQFAVTAVFHGEARFAMTFYPAVLLAAALGLAGPRLPWFNSPRTLRLFWMGGMGFLVLVWLYELQLYVRL